MEKRRDPKKFKEVFLSVRKIIALLVTIVFCYLSIIGRISSSEFIPVFSMIIGYYFGKSTALDTNISEKID
ncbi:hypothetical protein [Clostridium chauvoei]|uniref:Uncharacterized protein n=2 Tax=Clostridium chauvoei TaxID=46867 RepID=S6EKP6_9CLOT|nr:hypothetical protein [Clostridium chauvoei]ATD55139.1 hypothetical protein BTM20_07755 [Clostridium chauvoei]ATD57188.1 hypothetical protein BTM21_05300 [Clostridium chauvoei]MBX7279484.1 hypothetical protein [Clostridium chauvoei]MBX7282430.1 hypothetical protein [Clostridium chauvoei]MBX7285683.1 hypothetical protein [Clostridium chauvoei]